MKRDRKPAEPRRPDDRLCERPIRARAMNPADRKPESTFEIRKLLKANSVRSATGQLVAVWQAAGSTNKFCEMHL
jgi:hypothetical protein